MSAPRKISRDEQALRRRFNQLKRAHKKAEKEMWQTWWKICDLMYRKDPAEGER